MQKQMIGQALAVSDHPTAAEVYEQVRREYPRISLGTVYRNLASMADDGEILRLSFAGEPDRFDPKTHDHLHVICRVCGRIFDTDGSLPPKLVAQLDRAIEQSTGVAVLERTMYFAGVCQSCKGYAGSNKESGLTGNTAR
jgi:Fur family peroxide stress response transcriptional regulator